MVFPRLSFTDVQMVARFSSLGKTINPSCVVSLENLPIHFFNKAALFSIVVAVEKPLKIDEATANTTRPSFTRVYIEIDLLKSLPCRIWIGTSPSSGSGIDSL